MDRIDGKRRLYEKGTKDLIKAITKFEESEENFQLSLDFALSNFIYHQFLLPDIFQLKKCIAGLLEKYTIHADDDKAEQLRSLSTQYFEILSKEDATDREAGLAILSVLLNLHSSVPPAGPSTTASITDGFTDDTSEETFNWATYLRQDDLLESIRSSEDDCLVWSDSDVLSEDESQHRDSPPKSADSGIEVPRKRQWDIPPLKPPFRPYKPPTKPKVNQHITPYWELKFQITKLPPSDGNIHANFTKIWETHLSEQCSIYTPETNIVLTEYVILREILWMLHGTKELFVFKWSDDHYEVTRNIHLRHMTEVTLYGSLSTLCKYGNIVVSLLEFVNEACGTDISAHNVTRTYQTYAQGISHLLYKYFRVITSYEKLVTKGGVKTVLDLVKRLKPNLNKLEVLFRIHSNVQGSIVLCITTCEVALTILDSLWKQITSLGMSSIDGFSLYAVVFLFLFTFRPYLTMIEGVVLEGNLIDPCSEFPIQRNQEIEILDEMFYEKALQIRHLTINVNHNFLKPLFRHILLASKSIEMLNALQHVACTPLHAGNIPNIYNEFLKSFQALYESSHDGYSTHDGDQQHKQVKQQDRKVQKKPCGQDHEELDEQQELIRALYKSVNKSRKLLPDIYTHNQLCEKAAAAIRPGSTVLPTYAMKQAMTSFILNACHIVNKKLVKAMMEDYKLPYHMSVIRKYFLMEAGDVMFSFYTEIFNKMFEKNFWQDLYELNNIFQEATSFVDSDEVERLYVYLDDNCQINTNQPLVLLSMLRLSYKVEWPLNVIFSKEIQNSYNQIFRFLVQIKCAKYAIDSVCCIAPTQCGLITKSSHVLKWLTKGCIPKEQKIHGLHIIRMKLLYFINGFHTYIMRKIVHGSTLEFEKRLTSAKSLQDVITIHKAYLSTLLEYCFFDEKMPHFRWSILKILNIAIRFHQMWMTSVEKISDDELRLLENEFCSSTNFLRSCLNKPIKHGRGRQYMEDLASLILTDVYYVKVFP